MFIGIDFDNTIADYDNLFFNLAFEKKYIPKEKKLGKKEIKEKLIAQGKEEDWRLLQSIAYGSRMIEADLALGFSDFVKLQAATGTSAVSDLTFDTLDVTTYRTFKFIS